MKYALISVYDKSDVADFAKKLQGLGYTIISTGGTAKILQKEKVPVISVEKITGNPESFDGRVKTISFQIESGILYDRKKTKHIKEAADLKIPKIDIVVCNFYPFDKVVSDKTKIGKAIENIDVGGPTMMRSAAKNFQSVYAIFDPADYDRVIQDIKHKTINSKLRQELAAKTFSYLSWYDSHIAIYLNNLSLLNLQKSKKNWIPKPSNSAGRQVRDDGRLYPQYFPLNGKKVADLRYGDNPHQKAAWYLRPFAQSPFTDLRKVSGRDLSVTNLTDINAGIESVRVFEKPASAVIKHNTPCGVAVGNNPKQSLSLAIEADPVSAFGGVVVMNKPIDLQSAKAVQDFKINKKSQFDIIAAPGITDSAQKLLQSIRKTTGIYVFGKIPNERKPAEQIRWIDGGYAIQSSSILEDTDMSGWKVVTKKKPNKAQNELLKTAWKFISRVKSNCILIVDAKKSMTRGIGTGQTSRIGAAMIALEQAGDYSKGGIMASDGFFPFDDTVKLAAKHGISTIIQPGGSLRDKDSIKAADEAGISMVFIGKRLFWH